MTTPYRTRASVHTHTHTEDERLEALLRRTPNENIWGWVHAAEAMTRAAQEEGNSLATPRIVEAWRVTAAHMRELARRLNNSTTAIHVADLAAGRILPCTFLGLVCAVLGVCAKCGLPMASGQGSKRFPKCRAHLESQRVNSAAYYSKKRGSDSVTDGQCPMCGDLNHNQATCPKVHP